MSKSSPHLTIVIPAFNEEIRLSTTLPEIVSFCESLPFTVELLVVDDGSSDNTVQVVRSFAKKHRFVQVLPQKINQGKGAALKAGFARSKGEWILFMDADLSTPLSQFEKLWKKRHKAEIVIGSRKMKGAKVVARQHIIRENLGKVFTLLTNVLATGSISDVTCGFKLFEGTAGRRVFGASVLTDWSFDAEVLFLASRFGYRILEVPVEWHNDPRSKVSMLKDGIKALSGLLMIRFRWHTGAYTGTSQ